MRPPFKSINPSSTTVLMTFVMTFLLALTPAEAAMPPSPTNSTKTIEDDFDRLDGTGPSQTKVHVIEWEGNLEIHISPKGALKGLGVRLETENKSRPVLVLGYRLGNSARPLVRRAIIGIPWADSTHAYRDLTADSYDKLILSKSNLQSKQNHLVPFVLDAPPSTNYPEGHPSNTPLPNFQNPSSPLSDHGPVETGRRRIASGENSTDLQANRGSSHHRPATLLLRSAPDYP